MPGEHGAICFALAWRTLPRCHERQAMLFQNKRERMVQKMVQDSKWFVFKIGTKNLFSVAVVKKQAKRFALFKYLQLRIA